MIYIKSASSIIYSFIIFYYGLFLKYKNFSKLYLIILASIVFSFFIQDYIISRSVGDDLSFIQRFLPFFSLNIDSLIYGYTSISEFPIMGIHNGALYLIALVD